MQLNEIIEENTLPTISKRTRIAQENLKALVDRDWSRLKKVQALGFISILEREYGIDLSSLRQECRAYFESHELPQEKKKISVTSEEVAYSGRRRIFKVAVLLLLAFFAYESWHFFVAKNPTLESNATPAKKESFYDSVVDMAEGWFGGKETVEPDLGGPDEENGVTKGAWAEEKNESTQTAPEKNSTEKVAKVSAPKEEKKPKAVPKSKASSTESTLPAKSEQEEAKIIEKVKEEQAKQETRMPESSAVEAGSGNAAKEETKPGDEISQMIAAATPGLSDAGSETSTLETTPPSMQGKEVKKATESAAASAAKQEVAAKKQESAAQASEKSASPAAAAKGAILFHPFKKIWVGYTNLRTMKRVAKVTAADLTFDTSQGDYILATGHGMVEFRNADGTVLKLNDGQRHFFMIAKGGVREISHEAFQRLNKSKVW